jgi:hypothetical protein
VVGHCADNPPLKRERARHRCYGIRNEAQADLSDCLEGFHNPCMRRRVARHGRDFSALNCPWKRGRAQPPPKLCESSARHFFYNRGSAFDNPSRRYLSN